MQPGDNQLATTDKFSVSLLIASRVFRNFATGMVNVVFPYIVLTELHQGSFILGLIYTAATISTAILALLIGYATDLSPKTTFIVGLLLFPVSTLILYLIPGSLIAAFAAAIIGGYSASGSLAGGGVGGFIQPVQSTIAASVTSRADRTFYYGLLSFLSGVVAAAGAFVAGIPTISGALVLASAAGVISMIPGALLKKERIRSKHSNPQAKNEASRRRFGLKSANIIGKFGITGMINGFSNGLIIPFLIPFFILNYGVPRSEMALYTSVSGFIGAFALLLAPLLGRKLGFLKGIVLTRGMTVVLALLFPFIHFLPASLAIYFIFPPLRVIAMPVVQTAMTDMISTDELGRGFGINQGGRLAVASTGTAFAGYEFDKSSFEIPFIVYAFVMSANLYLYIRFFSSYREPKNLGELPPDSEE